MSSSNCCFMTCIQISQEAGQVVWYSHLFQNFPQFIVIHTVKGFDIVNKAEINVFLELSCFFDDPTDIGNLISGSSDFSKTSWNNWKFTVHVLLKPGLENFEHYLTSIQFSSVQFSRSVVSDSLRPHESQHARPPCPSPTPGVWLRLTSIESVMPSSHLILCRPLLLLPPISPSIRVFSSESTLCMRWPKYWSFSFSISPCNEHPGLISFRMDWLDLLSVQGTIKSLLQLALGIVKS